MKIQLLSDLHLEFAYINIENAGADTLVLSGDIYVADYFKRGEASPYYAQAQIVLDWFEKTCAKFKYVIYVLGNHEHYHGRFYQTAQLLKTILGHIKNLRVLDNEFLGIGKYTFFGTTLWTDFDHDNWKAQLVQNGLNDYKLIEGHNYRKLLSSETSAYHANARSRIESLNLENMIVVGHHAPSYLSVAPEYLTGRNSMYNPGYASRLDKFIESKPNIVLWTHGHCHTSSDYMVGKTRVVANPRGYAKGDGPPENDEFNPNLVLDI